MSVTSTRLLGVSLRLLVAGVCCSAAISSWNAARADYLVRQDTISSIRAAIQLEPDAWPYYLRLAQHDEDHARTLLETSLRLNPYNAEIDIELGLQYEADGDYARAEKLLLDAFAVDRTFVPRWTLANFYFRRADMPRFWEWARKAAQMPSQSTLSLFEMCWRVTPDPAVISQNVLIDNPDLNRQYLDFLIDKNQSQAAEVVAKRVVRLGSPGVDASHLLNVVNWLVAERDGPQAEDLWQSLIAAHWIQADLSTPNNPNFARDPLPVAFDWFLSSDNGLHSRTGPAGLITEFTGDQPEHCMVALQSLVLKPGNYSMDFTYSTSGIAPQTGLHWKIVVPGSETLIAASPDLSSDTLKEETLDFSVPPQAPPILLRLEYLRSLGTSRISGNLVIKSVRITPHP